MLQLFRVYLAGLLPGFGGMSLLAYCLSAFCGQQRRGSWGNSPHIQSTERGQLNSIRQPVRRHSLFHSTIAILRLV